MPNTPPRIRVRLRLLPDDIDSYKDAIEQIRSVCRRHVVTQRVASRFAREFVDAVYLVRGTQSVPNNVGNRYASLYKKIDRVVAQIDSIRNSVPTDRQFLGRHLEELQEALRAFAPKVSDSNRCKARFTAGKQQFVLETMPRGPYSASKERVANAAISTWFAYTGKMPAAYKESDFNGVLEIACRQAGVKAPGRVVLARQIAAFDATKAVFSGPSITRIWMKRTSKT